MDGTNSIILPTMDDSSGDDQELVETLADHEEEEEEGGGGLGRSHLDYTDSQSVDDLEPEGGGQTESGLSRHFKMSILRKLMRDFNLEETMDKYRGVMGGSGNRASLLRDNGQGQLDSTNRDTMAANRYWTTQDNQLNMDKLEAQIEREYQARMDKREDELADLERQRLRRLVVAGIIPPEELKEHGYATSRELHKSRRGTLQMSRRVRSPRRYARRSKSAPEHKSRMQNTSKPPVTPQPGQSRASGRKTSSSYLSPRRSTFKVDTQVNRLAREDARENSYRLSGRPTGRERSLGFGEGWRDVTPERPSVSQRSFGDPLIQELHEEETVGGMYSLAERILPADRPKSYLTVDPPRTFSAYKPSRSNRVSLGMTGGSGRR